MSLPLARFFLRRCSTSSSLLVRSNVPRRKSLPTYWCCLRVLPNGRCCETPHHVGFPPRPSIQFASIFVGGTSQTVLRFRHVSCAVRSSQTSSSTAPSRPTRRPLHHVGCELKIHNRCDGRREETLEERSTDPSTTRRFSRPFEQRKRTSETRSHTLVLRGRSREQGILGTDGLFGHALDKKKGKHRVQFYEGTLRQRGDIEQSRFLHDGFLKSFFVLRKDPRALPWKEIHA